MTVKVAIMKLTRQLSNVMHVIRRVKHALVQLTQNAHHVILVKEEFNLQQVVFALMDFMRILITLA